METFQEIDDELESVLQVVQTNYGRGRWKERIHSVVYLIREICQAHWQNLKQKI